MNPKVCWVSHPQEWHPLLEGWQSAHPKKVELHTWPQFGGAVVRGLTLAARGEGCGPIAPIRFGGEQKEKE
ncbi:MAG TPA: hypothetical protein EYP85_03640 [Armatimonadetes bacterium]|nr:hypothetical protein [Armatimonadota bacterium]